MQIFMDKDPQALQLDLKKKRPSFLGYHELLLVPRYSHIHPVIYVKVNDEGLLCCIKTNLHFLCQFGVRFHVAVHRISLVHLASLPMGNVSFLLILLVL